VFGHEIASGARRARERWRRRLWGGASVLLVPLLLVVSARPAEAQVCGDSYLTLDEATGTTLNLITTTANPWTIAPQGTAGTFYNALGYRPADDTMYAIQDQTNNLLRVNADGSTALIGAVSGLPAPAPNFYNNGGFGPDGFLYVRSSGDTSTVYRIDVTASPAAATAIPLSAPLLSADIVWFNGLFYGVSASGLQSFDPATGTVTTIGGALAGSFGGLLSGSNGVFAYENSTGNIYQVDVTTGAATVIANAPAVPNADAARCFTAPLQFGVDLSVTVDDGATAYTPGTDVVYTIVVTNNGPFGVQNASVSNPLPAGITTATWTCSGASGGVCEAASGSGSITDAPDLPLGATVTYVLTVTVPADRTGDLTDAVTVTPPAGFADTTPNDATDVDAGPAPVPSLPFVVEVLLLALLSAVAVATMRRARAA
jgi:uncharacterized repeat protein (TIGR01451 family)